MHHLISSSPFGEQHHNKLNRVTFNSEQRKKTCVISQILL